MKSFSLQTSRRTEMIAITGKIQELVREAGITEGVCTVFVPHTTAGITINENADPSVARDILARLAQLVPENGDYRHLEGNSDAHIKACLIGSSVSVIIQNGRLELGTWQGIFFCEFDGPRNRKCWVRLTPG